MTSKCYVLVSSPKLKKYCLHAAWETLNDAGLNKVEQYSHCMMGSGGGMAA